MSHLISNGRPTRPRLPSRLSPPSLPPLPVVVRATIGLTAAGIVGVAAPLLLLLGLFYNLSFWWETPIDRSECAGYGFAALAGLGIVVAAGWCLTRWGASSGATWPIICVAAAIAALLWRVSLSLVLGNWFGDETPILFISTYLIGIGVAIVWLNSEPPAPRARTVMIAASLLITVFAFAQFGSIRDVGSLCTTYENRSN